MKIKINKKTIIWIGLLLIILLVLILPFKIPYSINSSGKLFPAKEWIISRGTDGRLITVLRNNASGISSDYSVSQFERGDAIQFAIRPNISAGDGIAKNDTIASIYSNEIERQFAELKGELETAKASLAAIESGEKQATVKEEEARLDYMKKQAEEQKKIYKRLETLYRKNLASQEEYEIAKGTADLNDINIKIAEAHLQSVQTGMKKEEIDLIKTQIQSLQKQIDILQKRFDHYTLISKISGVANSVLGSDTLLTISDTTEFVVIIPVKWEEKKYLSINQEVKLTIPDGGGSFLASISRIDEKVHQLYGTQVVLVTAVLEGKPTGVTPGLIIECKIKCEAVRTISFMNRIFNSIFG